MKDIKDGKEGNVEMKEGYTNWEGRKAEPNAR